MQQPNRSTSQVVRQFQCPECSQWNTVPATDGAVTCTRCGASHVWHEDAVEGNRLSRCPLCGEAMMYVKKDFPHGWGLAILLAGFAISTLLWFYFEYIWALGVLVLTALIDALLFFVIGEVTACYRCGSVFRGFEPNPEHGPWDLEIGESFRHRRKRQEKAQAGGAGTS